MSQLSEHALQQLFTEARTHHGWDGRPVADETLHHIYNLMKWAPTATNCCPARIVFVTSREAKEKLKPCLSGSNVEQTMSAPATAILCYDMKFYEKLPLLSPANNAVSWYTGEGKEKAIQETAFRNGTLQGGYFILAARSLGLDCGPMSGFNNARVDEAFLAGTSWKSNFLCNIGHGDPGKLYPRADRLLFHDACRID